MKNASYRTHCQSGVNDITQFLILLTIITVLSGCSTQQLNYNTADIASSIQTLYATQVLSNLSKFIDEPNTIPSQVDITNGLVQTSYIVNPNITFPLSSLYTAAIAAATGVTGAITGTTTTKTTTTAGGGMGISLTDSWQQNYQAVPIKDANTLRNMRALYKYAIYGDIEELNKEYHIFFEAYKEQPHCVFCKTEVNEELKKNEKLKSRWLYWKNDAGSSNVSPENPPPEPNIRLGHFGSHELYMTEQDYKKGYLADFILFLLPNQVTERAANLVNAQPPAVPTPAAPKKGTKKGAKNVPLNIPNVPAPHNVPMSPMMDRVVPDPRNNSTIFSVPLQIQ